MLLSHKYKFIVIQPPKTGTTTLDYVLKQIDPDIDKNVKETGLNISYPPYRHVTAKNIRSLVGDKIYDDYYKFVLMREPYSWFKSWYNHRLNENYTDQPGLFWLLDQGHPDYPDNFIISKRSFIQAYVLGSFYISKYQAPNLLQTEWMNDKIDHIGVFENINDEWEKFKQVVGITGEWNLPIKNARPRSTELKFDSEVNQLFSILYKKDIDFYNNITQK